MTVIYRTPGAWGPGKGTNLTAHEVDTNFWDLISQIQNILANPPNPNSIESITVAGGQMTIHLSDGSTQGPFTMPVAVFQPRGDWQPSTLYAFLDLVSHPTGMYMVMQNHTSDTTFNPSDPRYDLMVPPGPTGAEGPEGPAGATGPAGADAGPFEIDANGPLANRSAYDDEAQGFVYLSEDGDGVDVTSAVVYIHGPGGTGDWAGGYIWEGPKGDVGPSGSGFQVDANGPFVERADFDGEAMGFVFLSTDGDGPGGLYTTGVLYFHQEDPGVWSDPVPFVAGPPGANYNANASGPYAGRSAYDAQLTGFSYLSTNGAAGAGLPAVLYFKNSATSGDWSSPVPFQGPVGPAGPAGPTGANFDVDAAGTYAGRAAHDAAAQGYSYLSTDGDGGLTTFQASIYIKNSATSGDWSARIPFQGPQGPQGPQGATGNTGATGAAGSTGPAGTPGQNYDADATGTFAGRAAYDSQPKDFSYLSTNGDGGANTAPSLYIKASNAAGDWGPRIPFQGPQGVTGPKGDPGAMGPAGPKGDKGDKGDPGASGGGSATPPAVVLETAAVALTKATHANKYVKVTSATPVNVTIATDASQVWDAATEITIRQGGAGQLTIAFAGGVTLDVPTGTVAKCRGQGSTVMIKRAAANTWDLTGDLELA